ncbi:hypothetical protein NLJ89_g11646 [Agrocybe chaxingu]|uniref:Uncharacterized protein n=1 Tax=Agrocybe chaxingu TaxID=84603 RepID=A0A9W8JNZ6_9AGAR|nr:hypothetical protein NLJ89_g11646 [Agrocybe chaxingu]
MFCRHWRLFPAENGGGNPKNDEEQCSGTVSCIDVCSHTDEYILQSANRVPDAESTFKQAPEPLLPNYGYGRIRQYNIDIDMMTMLNSEERQLPEFVKLGEAAGLRFEKLWDFGETGVAEFRLS